MSIALVGCSNSNDSDQSSNEKSSSKSSENKTDVATEYTKEDEYKELEKKLRIINKSQFLMKSMHLLQKKVLPTKQDCKAGKTIKING